MRNGRNELELRDNSRFIVELCVENQLTSRKCGLNLPTVLSRKKTSISRRNMGWEQVTDPGRHKMRQHKIYGV